MTKKEFKYMEKVCKDLWKWLANHPSETKEELFFQKFLHGCPACELTKKRDYCSYYTHDCTLCPIDVWRKRAIKYTNEHSFQLGESLCEGFKSAYSEWRNFDSEKIRKKAALSISKYKWTMLPEHSEKRFLKKYKCNSLIFR